MSQQKLVFPMTVGRKKRSFWPWLWGGITILAVIICITLFCCDDASDLPVEATPIELNDFGMQEWDSLADLIRQDMDDDFSNDAPEVIPENTDPFLIKGRITRNQTLFVALKNQGLDIADIHQLIAAMQNVIDFKKTKPGDRYEVHLDVDKRILKFIYEISPEDISIAERVGNDFSARKVDVNKRTERLHLSGELVSSLYQTIVGLGESGELASTFMKLFKYDINFGTDSQKGDTFSIIVDKITLNGKFYRYGRVWAASYSSNALGKKLEAYYFDTDSEYAGYYTADGHALKRTFLKNPVVGCPVSSPFNPKRMHPILKRIRPHNGIDWACPTGTPIMAFADGVVTFAGWKGGNGNLLVIEHAHGYTSVYAHLYSINRKIQKGTKVKQGQIVATVGNTGISTGPHLHFGVKINGKYVDPAKIDSSYSIALTGKQLHAFNQVRSGLRAELEAVPNKEETAQQASAHK